MDPRFSKFADVLVNYSVGVKKGNIVIVDVRDGVPEDMVLAVIRAVNAAGGKAMCWYNTARILREVICQKDKRLFTLMANADLTMMSSAEKYIVLRSFVNISELADVPADALKLFSQVYGDTVHDERIEYTDWILSRWPTQAMAQLAGMSTDQFTDFFFKTVLLDYRKMAAAALPLQKLIEATDKVHIKGPGTDLKFSIRGIGAMPCVGTRNIPDGEVYTAPIRNSVNGVLTYNSKAIYEGQTFEGISFTFKDGKIVKATCQVGDQDRLNKTLDADEGARYLGEFAFGFNPYITETMGETLFDEKVAGSIHITPGRAYAGTPADNGNRSTIHWDLVLVQTAAKGGGSIFFDGKLIRKDGLFVPKALQGLNPENLKD